MLPLQRQQVTEDSSHTSLPLHNLRPALAWEPSTLEKEGQLLGTFVAATETYQWLCSENHLDHSSYPPSSMKNGFKCLKQADTRETEIIWGSEMPNRFDSINCFKLRVCIKNQSLVSQRDALFFFLDLMLHYFNHLWLILTVQLLRRASNLRWISSLCA